MLVPGTTGQYLSFDASFRDRVNQASVPEFYDRVMEITERLGVTDQILIKGKRPIEVVAEQEAKYQHNMMYMPIVDIQNKSGIAPYNSYMEQGVVPIAYEVCWHTDDGAFERACREIKAQGSKIWVNTIWASLCGGNGVSMIQTDRPELLINYLTKIGRHTLM